MPSLIRLTVMTSTETWSPERRGRALLICAAEEERKEVLMYWGAIVRQVRASPLHGRHAAGCSCCARDPVAMQLAGIYQDRVVGRQFPFHEVALLASEDDVGTLVTLLRDDVLIRARFDLVF